MNSKGPDLTAYRFDGQVVANFVTTGQGVYKDDNGSSRGISNEVDRDVLIHLRSQATAVLVGGETARNEGYRPDSRFETIVLTRRDLGISDGLTRLKTETDWELSEEIRQIRARHNSLLLEAGPSLISKLAELRVIDTLCLSVVDPVGEPNRLLKLLFDIDEASLKSSQEVGDTLLTVWRLK